MSFAAALSMVVLLVLAACGGAEPTATPAATRPPATPAPTATRPPGPPTPTSMAAPLATPTPAPQPTLTPRGPAGTLNPAVQNMGSEGFIIRLHTPISIPVLHMTGHSLFGYSLKDRSLEGRWASQWSYQKVGADNVWAIKLRPGVVINEGWGTVSVEDVKFQFTEFLKPDAISSSVVTALALIDKDLNNFEIVGPLEFRLHSTKFDPIAPVHLTGALETPYQVKAYSEKVGDEGWDNHPIGTGSFIFKSRTKGSKYTLEAVPNHWRKTASAQTINLLIVPESATRLAMLKTGQIDLTSLEGRFKRELTGNLRPFLVPDTASVFVALGGMYYDLPDKNCATCPWVGYTDSARKVREALIVSVDRQAVLDRILFGMGKLMAAPYDFPAGAYAWVDPAWKPLPYDPARARQLLAQAGYPNGFEIEMAQFATAALQEMVDISEATAGYWEAIGIKVKRTPMDWSPTFRTFMQNRTTAGMAWVITRTIPLDMYDGYHFFVREGALIYFTDPKAREFAEKAGKEPDAAKRALLGRELGQYYIDERLGVPLFSVSTMYGVTDKVVSWDRISGHSWLTHLEYVTIKS